MSNRVLVIAAHPDDEVLGCGGMIARHAAAGDTVAVLLLADGETARGTQAAARVAGRGTAARAAADVLGVADLSLDALPDNRLDTVPLIEVVQRIEAAIARLAPALVYTHHGGDLNVDHRVVHQAVLTACRPLPGHPVRSIRCFEVLSSTDWGGTAGGTPFRPNLFCDIASTLPRKLEALRCYDEEMRAFPHARSYEAVEALARHRGASAGLHAAEAFVIERQLD